MEDFELMNTIKVERAKRNMSQADLAFQISVSRKTINTIETGKFVPSTIIALRIAQVFNTTVESIFQIKEPL
ncbi:MAG: helix-turn-helix transcriptional regulator [Bacteroidota bacterium]